MIHILKSLEMCGAFGLTLTLFARPLAPTQPWQDIGVDNITLEALAPRREQFQLVVDQCSPWRSWQGQRGRRP
jgi:hypothetical protein